MFGSLRNELVYTDMPKAREYANEFEEGIKGYNISPEQIIRHSNFDSFTMRSALMEARDKMMKSKAEGRRTLLICFYAGRGGKNERGEKCVLLNSNVRGENEFEL